MTPGQFGAVEDAPRILVPVTTELSRFALPLKLPDDPAALHDDPFIWSIQALGLAHGTPMPPTPLLGLLTGGCFVHAACAGTCGYWWLGAGKARRRLALQALFGWSITHLSTDGTQESYEALLKGPASIELTFGRPILAYGGWPGPAAYHWGIVVVTGSEHRPGGYTPFSADLTAMTSWPYRLHLVKPEAAPQPIDATLIRDALLEGVGIWADVVGSETADQPPEAQWHSGSAALEVWRGRLEQSGPFCVTCTDEACLPAVTAGYAANLGRTALGLDAAAGFLESPQLTDLASRYRALAVEVKGAGASTDRVFLSEAVASWHDQQAALLADLGAPLAIA